MQFLDTLKLLASNSETQVKYLDNLGTFPMTDELALQFIDLYPFFIKSLERLDSDSVLKKEIISNIYSIKFHFDKMSETTDISIWNISALNNSDWNLIRDLAINTLNILSRIMEL